MLGQGEEGNTSKETEKDGQQIVRNIAIWTSQSHVKKCSKKEGVKNNVF